MKLSPRSFGLWLLSVVIVWWLFDLAQVIQTEPVIDYSEFLRQLEIGNVRDVSVSDQTLKGEFLNPAENQSKRFVTLRVDSVLAQQLGRGDVRFRSIGATTSWSSWLSALSTILVLFLLWRFLVSRSALGAGAASSLMSIGRSRARVYMETGIKVSFEDVAGVDEAKEELREVVDFLRDPQAHGRLGARIPRGVLLVGPPGTGKTLLAKAVAGEAGVPFFSINGSEFVELFVGVGAARVRDLFEQARARAPAIVFIDEIDALGRARGAFGLGGHDEKEQTLNQLLAELDGFDPSSGVVLLAATNRPEILDPALLRAGRFDRQVLVDRPDKTGRIQILTVHLKRILLDASVDMEVIASLTPGFSGADLANLVNEAALLATRREHRAVMADDFTDALERIVAGLEKRNRLLNAAERRTVAFHEMGHAITAITLLSGETVHKVSIIPRGVGSLGYTIQRPIEDRFLMTRDELCNKLTVLLAGRAAEQLCLGDVSTGAADDLVRATRVARSMVTQYGMVPALGAQAFELAESTDTSYGLKVPPSTGAALSDATVREIDCAVRELIDQALARAMDLLGERKVLLEKGAERLLARETLAREELLELCATFSEASDSDESAPPEGSTQAPWPIKVDRLAGPSIMGQG